MTLTLHTGMAIAVDVPDAVTECDGVVHVRHQTSQAMTTAATPSNTNIQTRAAVTVVLPNVQETP